MEILGVSGSLLRGNQHTDLLMQIPNALSEKALTLGDRWLRPEFQHGMSLAPDTFPAASPDAPRFPMPRTSTINT